MGQLEQAGGLFGSTTGARSSGRPATPTKPAKRVDNPKVKPKTVKKSKGGGGAMLLGVGVLTLTGVGIAAASLSKRKVRKLRKLRKKRSRR